MKALAAFFLLLATALANARTEVVLGVHTEEPAATIGALIAQAEPNGASIRLQTLPSATELWRALDAGRIDLALVEETGELDAAAAMVADIYPGVLHILHSAAQGPENLGDLLRSGPIWAGAPGGIGYRVAQSLAQDFGLAADELKLLDDPWAVTPQVYFMFGGILAPQAIARLTGFKLYSLDDPLSLMHGSVAEGVALRYPNLRPFTLPAQLYPALGETATLTLSVATGLVARAGLDEDIVYELAAAVDAMRPQIAALYPLAGLPQLTDTVRQASAMPLHPGARHYRDRDMPGFIERYSQVMGMAATVIIATVSLLMAWRRHRKQQRKDKLDTYYQKLLGYRDTLPESAADRATLAAQVRATQAEVMEAVIAERIDADGALLAFLSLSNQVLVEAQSDPCEPATAAPLHRL